MSDPLDDPPLIWRRTVQRARRAYACCECHRQIEPGEIYERYFEVYYRGEGETTITCIECAEVRQQTLDEDGCMPAFGDLAASLANGSAAPELVETRAGVVERGNQTFDQWRDELHRKIAAAFSRRGHE